MLCQLESADGVFLLPGHDPDAVDRKQVIIAALQVFPVGLAADLVADIDQALVLKSDVGCT